MNDIDDKYVCDVDILSITFNYYKKDGDLLESPNDVLETPTLILLCRSGKFGEATADEPTGFIGHYYFKLIFINPSSYSFHLGRYHYVPTSYKAKDTPNMSYSFSAPFTYEMEETQLASDHYQWVIFFDNKTKEKEFIKIFADKLEVEDLDLKGHPDLDKVMSIK